MRSPWPKTVAILFDGADEGGDFGRSFADGFRAHGCEARLVPRNESSYGMCDLALAYGPFRLDSSMLPLARRLLAQPPGARPCFAWWLTEGVPSRRLPAWVVEGASRLRLRLDRSPLVRGRRWLSRGHRLRVFGELRWLHSHGLLDVLAVTSASRAAYLQRRGFAPVVVPLGYHPAYYGEELGLPRDVDVCFIGNVGSPRRQRVLTRVRKELSARGIALAVHDNLYGAQRTHVLNRCRIMLNILRAPHDFVGQRFLLGAANKTLIVSEPINDEHPFEPGRHVVVTPIERMAETVARYLSQEAERGRIVDEAYRLVTQELTIAQMTGRILARARESAGATQRL